MIEFLRGRRHVLTVARMRVIAALYGFAGVALGAFGAHALRPALSTLATADAWTTASLYHLVHSAVLMCIAMARPAARTGYWLLLAGITLFSGSLYVFALTGLRSLAMLAPVGGVCLLAGWISLAFHGGGGVDDDAQS